MVFTQQLKPTDYFDCRTLCERINLIHNAEMNIFDLVLSDKAYFHLDGNVNKQNIHEQSLHSPKLQVWCVLAKWGMIGPYIFTSNVNTVVYVVILKTFFIRVSKKKHKFSQMVFQQDGAKLPTSGKSLTLLQQTFKMQYICSHTDFWPPHSPDLTARNFFLWGYGESLCLYE